MRAHTRTRGSRPPGSPTAGVLPSLQLLSLSSNQITDEGCAALASALRSGALPALNSIGGLMKKPASEEAHPVHRTKPCAWKEPRVQSSRRCCAQ